MATIKDCCEDRYLFNEEYDFMVRQCADNDLPIDLSNRHIDHAIVLTRNILKKTQREVYFLTGRLHSEFCEAIIDDLKTALDNHCKVEIAFVEDEAIPDKIRALQKQSPRHLILRKLRGQFRDRGRSLGHFCVSDNCRYRMEENHPYDQDFTQNKEVKAVANFNAPQIAKDLVRFYRKVCDMCEAVPA